jgi:hypothetical protein
VVAATGAVSFFLRHLYVSAHDKEQHENDKKNTFSLLAGYFCRVDGDQKNK